MFSVRKQSANLQSWSQTLTDQILQKGASIVLLDHNEITEFHEDKLRAVAHIVRKLDLSHNNLTSSAAQPLQFLTGLTHLTLNNNNQLEQVPFLYWLPHLAGLDLSHNSLISLELPLSHPEHMLELNLANNMRVPTTLPYAMLLRMNNLRTLNLANNMIALAANDPVANVLPLGELSSLHLDGASMGGYTELSFLRHSTKLLYLYLRECYELWIVPPVIRNMTQLRVLDMQNCTSLERLIVYPSAHSDSLRSLNVSGCNIEMLDESLADLSNLRTLRLGGGNARMNRLPANMSALTHLKTLTLNSSGWLPQYFRDGMHGIAIQYQRRLHQAELPEYVVLELPAAITRVINNWSWYFANLGVLQALPLLRKVDFYLAFRRYTQRQQWNESNVVTINFGDFGSVSLPRNQTVAASAFVARVSWDMDVELGTPPAVLVQALGGSLTHDALHRYCSDIVYGYVDTNAELKLARAFTGSAYWLKSAARFLLKLWLACALEIEDFDEPTTTTVNVFQRLFVTWVVNTHDDVDEFPNAGVANLLREPIDHFRELSEIATVRKLCLMWFGDSSSSSSDD